MTTPYAHSKSINGKWEPLQEHLLKTARLCAAYCKEAYLHENEGYVAGLCHDLGKCGDLFQRVLHGREKRVDHESSGAYWLLRTSGFAAYDKKYNLSDQSLFALGYYHQMTEIFKGKSTEAEN